jgi:hypothetical protein
MLRYNDVKTILFVAPGQQTCANCLCTYAFCNYVIALKFSTFVYVLGKSLVKFHRFFRYFKEVRENDKKKFERQLLFDP